MMKVVSFLIKILKYKVLSFLVSNFDIFADSLQQGENDGEKGMEEDQTWDHHFCDGIFQCNTICGIWKK